MAAIRSVRRRGFTRGHQRNAGPVGALLALRPQVPQLQPRLLGIAGHEGGRCERSRIILTHPRPWETRPAIAPARDRLHAQGHRRDRAPRDANRCVLCCGEPDSAEAWPAAARRPPLRATSICCGFHRARSWAGKKSRCGWTSVAAVPRAIDGRNRGGPGTPGLTSGVTPYVI